MYARPRTPLGNGAYVNRCAIQNLRYFRSRLKTCNMSEVYIQLLKEHHEPGSFTQSDTTDRSNVSPQTYAIQSNVPKHYCDSSTMYIIKKSCCCCCCHDEPVRHCLYGGTDVPKRWGIQPDSESGGIHLSLVIDDSHFIDWGTTQGRLSLPTADALSTIVKRWMLMDVDKLSSCSRFSDSSGFYGSKDPTNSIKVLKEQKIYQWQTYLDVMVIKKFIICYICYIRVLWQAESDVLFLHHIMHGSLILHTFSTVTIHHSFTLLLQT